MALPALLWLLAWPALLISLLWTLLVLLQNRRLIAQSRRLPGPRLWLPGLGSMADVILRYGLNNIDWVWGFYKRFGNVYAMWIGNDLVVITSNPDDIEAVTTNPALIDKAPNYAMLRPWLGDGLLLLGGKKWHSRRKLLTPSFHFRTLDQFVNVFNDQGDVLESKLDALVGQGAVDVRPYISRHALDVICETAMGTSLDTQRSDNSEYVQAVKMACTRTNDRSMLYALLKNDTLFRMTCWGRDFYRALGVMHSVVRKVVNSRKDALRRELREGVSGGEQAGEHDIGLRRRHVFIDQLLTMHLQGEDLSDQDVFDEVNTFMFEGHDTTMTSVSFTLYLLANHPEVQERAAEEVQSVAGSTRLTPAHLAELKYLDAVVKESLRRYPSVPAFFRACKSDLVLPSGHTVPAGALIMINVMMAHHDEKNFSDPFRFDPDRFLSGGDGQRHHFAYLPFSAGSRNCIGQRFAMMSMKTTLARLLRSFRFLPPPGGHELSLDFQVVLTTLSGVPLVVERRNKVA